MEWERFDSLVTRQLGLATTPQLIAAGATPGWVRYQMESGLLVPVRRRVVRAAGAPQTQDQAWLAAVLAAQADVVLSHRSAAAAWGLRGFDPPERIDLLGLRWRPRLPGVAGHLTQWLPASDRTVLRAVPVTTCARTLIDASGGLHPWALGRVVDDALRRKLLGLPRLVRCFEEVPTSGRRPSKAMREVLTERIPGFNPGGSAAELDVLRILRRAGIRPLPVQQYRVRLEGHNYVLDYAWAEVRHVIEFDGKGGHDTVTARHDDRDRFRRLIRAGWTVWPITERTSESEIIAIGVTATEALRAA